MGADKRASARHRVHLSVRYATAKEFVREYAENLSHGGLYVTGEDLQPLEEITVEIELPGLGRFRVLGEVVHVISAEVAAKLDRLPGAGVAIKKAPPGFTDALTTYLHRLGRRADHLVLTSHEGIAKVLGDAGYQVSQVPPPDEVVQFIATATTPVVALVVSSAQLEDYAEVARTSGAGDIALSMDYYSELDAVLTQIDDML